MARTSNEFGGGEIVPAIEAITGIQAPVREDFVAVPFGTVNHEHGERRQIQNQANNLKGSSGIERIPFNGIDELDTEQGPNGEVVHALNTGDSRIRFVGSGWNIFSSGTIGTVLRTLTINDYVEITFFGTALNLLVFQDNTTGYDWRAIVDGGTESGNLRPTNPSDVLKGNRKTNVILPVTSGLSAGAHTVRIRNFANPGTGTDGFTVYGCEIINENPVIPTTTTEGITQQPGADFDGRVEALGATTFPIKPLNTTISSLNSRNGASEAFTGTTGARVLNYITSGGQFKQSFDIADEVLVTVAGQQEYTLEIQNGGSSSITLPTSVSTFTLSAFGGGGGGGGSGGATKSFGTAGAGGGGGSKAGATFTRGASTQAETLALVISGTAAGSFNLLSGRGTTGGVTTVTTGGTAIAATTGGQGGDAGGILSGASDGGDGGAIGVSQTFTGWTIASQVDAVGGDGLNGGGQNGLSGAGGNVGGFAITPLTGTEGQGGTGRGTEVSTGTTGNPGQTPGGGGGGISTSPSAGFGNTGGTGAAGRVYLTINATSGLGFADFGVGASEFTAGAVVGGVLNSPLATFGNTAFDANRLNQEVIRRINFREFGANNAFATGTNNIAFTLDDGTTTLVSENLSGGNGSLNGTDYLSFHRATAGDGDKGIFFTFVGTGLDLAWVQSAGGGTLPPLTVSIDGLSIGVIGDLPDAQENQWIIRPIVSGLAYGTHTVSIETPNYSTGGATAFGPGDFIIYGPKKPEIPTLDVGSLELSDYNVMADYDRLSANRTGGVSKGVVTKSPGREFLYTPQGWAYADDNSLPFGARAAITSATAEARYTFYGTGIEFFASSTAGGLPTKGIGLTLPGSTTEVRLDRTNFSITYQKIIDITAVTSTSITVSFGTNSTADVNAFIATDVITFDDAAASTATVSSVATATGVITIDALPSGITATNNVVQIAQQGSSSTPVTVGQVEGSYFSRVTNSSFSVSNGANARIQVSGLPLGVTTARLFNTGNEVLRILGANIITPIHINDDTLKVGSEGLNNLTIDPVVEEDEAVVLANLGEAKAWLNYDLKGASTGGDVISSLNIAAVIQTSNSRIIVYLDKPFKDDSYVVVTSSQADSTPAISVHDGNDGAGLAVRANSFVLTGNAVLQHLYCAAFGELIDE